MISKKLFTTKDTYHGNAVAPVVYGVRLLTGNLSLVHTVSKLYIAVQGAIN